MTDEPYLQFQIPDVPYSAVRFSIAGDGETVREEAVRALQAAFWFRDKFLDTFPEPEQEEQQERPQQRQQAPRGNAVAYCPEHDMAPCVLSAPQYNKDGDRLYHPLNPADQYKNQRGDLVKNHNLYWRQTVDASGESNYGKLIPTAQPPRRAVVAGYQGDEPPPYDDEALPF